MASDLDERQAALADGRQELMVDEVHEEHDQFAEYRSLSGLAVTALIVGCVSPLAFVAPFLLIVPILGMVLGLLAIRQIRRERDYLTGTRLAVIGVVLSLVLATTAGAMHSILGVLEVPEGYEEIHFWQLQPDKVNHPDMPIPPAALELDGQRVFVRGYVFPGTKQTGLKKFILVPDMKTCCFGGDPELTDMIAVTLADPLEVDCDLRRRGLGGILRVHRELKAGAESKQVCYEMEADYLK